MLTIATDPEAAAMLIYGSLAEPTKRILLSGMSRKISDALLIVPVRSFRRHYLRMRMERFTYISAAACGSAASALETSG
jgi:hypothetical protein